MPTKRKQPNLKLVPGAAAQPPDRPRSDVTNLRVSAIARAYGAKCTERAHALLATRQIDDDLYTDPAARLNDSDADSQRQVAAIDVIRHHEGLLAVENDSKEFWWRAFLIAYNADRMAAADSRASADDSNKVRTIKARNAKELAAKDRLLLFVELYKKRKKEKPSEDDDARRGAVREALRKDKRVKRKPSDITVRRYLAKARKIKIL